MANLPTDVAQQALDAIGSEKVISDLEDGSREASILLRAYRNCLMQLLRAAHWNFARKQAPMVLLADATGQTPNVGTRVADPEFLYEYQYPIDCTKARFVPMNPHSLFSPAPGNNIALPQIPMTTGTLQTSYIGQKLRPARWLEATDFNYPAETGQISWETQGVSPQGRTVIMTNVRDAYLVYTALMLYPSVWDSLFRAALVAYLASEVALAVSKDKKFGLQVRGQMIALVKAKLTEARLVDGNEGFFSSDIPVDWIETRRAGAPGGAYGYDRLGGGFARWSTCSFSDGSAF